MTDRELLELAAKVAGIEVTAVVVEGIPYRFGGGYWNPLTDYGDRYRLIKQLEIVVNFKYQYAEYEGICVFWPQDVEDDAHAVLAVAAEIWRMK